MYLIFAKYSPPRRLFPLSAVCCLFRLLVDSVVADYWMMNTLPTFCTSFTRSTRNRLVSRAETHVTPLQYRQRSFSFSECAICSALHCLMVVTIVCICKIVASTRSDTSQTLSELLMHVGCRNRPGPCTCGSGVYPCTQAPMNQYKVRSRTKATLITLALVYIAVVYSLYVRV